MIILQNKGIFRGFLAIKHQENNIDPANWAADHGDYLFRFAMIRLRNQTKAEDAVQETFLAALRTQNNYSARSTVRTWLTGILKHKILDLYRAAKREPEQTPADDSIESIDDLYKKNGHLNNPALKWPGNPRDAFEKEEFWLQLHACIEKLPERQAAIFTLRELDGLSSEEICKVMDISSTNYWVILHRCRIALRRCLEINWFKED